LLICISKTYESQKGYDVRYKKKTKWAPSAKQATLWRETGCFSPSLVVIFIFEQHCEKPLIQIADSYSDLLQDRISLFSGTSAHGRFGSDIAVVLYPLPKVPVLICSWRPDKGMDRSAICSLTMPQNKTS